jgi:hypothetical protein
MGNPVPRIGVGGLCGAHKLSLFTDFAKRRYPANEASKIPAAALEMFASQLCRLLPSGGGMPIPGARRDRVIARRGNQGGADQRLDRGLIGDTALDLQCGTNTGAGWVIGVLSGAHDLATLGRTPHTHMLPSIADLPLLLGRLSCRLSSQGALAFSTSFFWFDRVDPNLLMAEKFNRSRVTNLLP